MWFIESAKETIKLLLQPWLVYEVIFLMTYRSVLFNVLSNLFPNTGK